MRSRIGTFRSSLGPGAMCALVLTALWSPALHKDKPHTSSGIYWCPMFPYPLWCVDIGGPDKPKKIEPIKCHETAEPKRDTAGPRPEAT